MTGPQYELAYRAFVASLSPAVYLMDERRRRRRVLILNALSVALWLLALSALLGIVVTVMTGCAGPTALERHALAAHRTRLAFNQALTEFERVYETQLVEACRSGESEVEFEELKVCQNEVAGNEVRNRWAPVWSFQEELESAHGEWRESIELGAAMQSVPPDIEAGWSRKAVLTFDALVRFFGALQHMGLQTPSVPQPLLVLVREP